MMHERLGDKTAKNQPREPKPKGESSMTDDATRVDNTPAQDATVPLMPEDRDVVARIRQLAADHYWDSLSEHKETVIKHLDSILSLASVPQEAAAGKPNDFAETLRALRLTEFERGMHNDAERRSPLNSKANDKATDLAAKADHLAECLEEWYGERHMMLRTDEYRCQMVELERLQRERQQMREWLQTDHSDMWKIVIMREHLGLGVTEHAEALVAVCGHCRRALTFSEITNLGGLCVKCDNE